VHREALEWVHENAPRDALTVLDIGGRDVNGSPRGLFEVAAAYRVVDRIPGPGVDVVADAATWTPDRAYDVVLCCEVFEHDEAWRLLITTAWEALRPDGLFVATMAGPGRESHSGIDGGTLRDGEYYANIEPTHLQKALARQGFGGIVMDQVGPDLRCRAMKPGA